MKSLAQLGLISVLIGCGGRLGEEPGARSDTDSGTVGYDAPIGEDAPVATDGPAAEDVPVVAPGFKSYTATLSSVTTTWMGGSPGAGSPSEGYAFRIDLEPGTGVRAFIMAPFSDAVIAGGTTKLSAVGGGLLLTVSQRSSYRLTTERYDALEIEFDASGKPIRGRLTGRAIRSEGDVEYSGTVDAKVSFAPDTTKPTWRTTATTSFASVPLPWDEWTVEASEPYEETVSLSPLFGSVISGSLKGTPMTQNGEIPRERGVRFRQLDWNVKLPSMVTPQAVSDRSGNVAASASVPIAAETIAKRSAKYLRFDDDAGMPMRWGAVSIGTVGCRSGKMCAAINAKLSACTRGSRGGIATRLMGSGVTTAVVRAVAAKGTMGFGGGTPSSVAILGAAFPGGGASTTTGSELKWTTAADGSLDTGWTTLTLKMPATEAETGVAISVGGVGAPSNGCEFTYPPMATEYEVTVYVEELAIAP
jgi:hypothetical protein